jgi:chromosome partitioning protein
MTITLCNGKGGSGKTTLTILLASALSEAGHDVAVVDTDPQKTATRWISETGHLKLAQPGAAPTALFIDTPPRLESKELAESLSRADVIVVVTSPSPADLFTSRDTAQLIQDRGLAKRAYVLFNQVQGGTVLARELDDLSSRIGLPSLKNRVHRRQAYQHAVLLGWKSLPGEAREEIFKVALEITALVK